MLRKVTAGILTLSVWLFSFHVCAASLQMYPVIVNFCNGEKARPVYVKNTGTAPVTAQIRVYQWTQVNHKDQLAETKELISGPPMTSISAGEQQLIRLLIPDASPLRSTETAYRLIVDELPEAGKQKTSQVRFLLHYSVPVFLHANRSNLIPIKSMLY